MSTNQEKTMNRRWWMTYFLFWEKQYYRITFTSDAVLKIKSTKPHILLKCFHKTKKASTCG
jgi:hypothetical protein